MQIRGAKYVDIWGKCPATAGNNDTLLYFLRNPRLGQVYSTIHGSRGLAPSVNWLGESHLAISLMDADGSKEWEMNAARIPAKKIS